MDSPDPQLTTFSRQTMDVQKFKRSSSLYFPDGDIAVSADFISASSKSAYVFRVHRLYLSNASPVFKDMFVVVSPEQPAIESYDDVPLIHMAGDDAYDVHSLLSIIYNASALHKMLSSTPTADLLVKVEGLARIAKKYMVQDIEQVVVDHIKSLWPQSAHEWETYMRRPRDFRTKNAMMEPAAAFLFALEHDVHEILPATFYQLATSEISDWDPGDSTQPASKKTIPQARWRLLSKRGCLLAFTQARDKFNCEVRSRVYELAEWSKDPTRGRVVGTCVPGGRHPAAITPQCQAALRTLCTEKLYEHYIFPGDVMVVDYLERLDTLLDDTKDKRGFCSGCWTSLSVHVKSIARDAIWDDATRISRSFLAVE